MAKKAKKKTGRRADPMAELRAKVEALRKEVEALKGQGDIFNRPLSFEPYDVGRGETLGGLLSSIRRELRHIASGVGYDLRAGARAKP